MAGPPTPKDIERRAYHLWEQAGMPNGRDREFIWKRNDSLGKS
ncbi:DUF2934 domain-containing protein [Bradyrhizobium sp. SSUT112]